MTKVFTKVALLFCTGAFFLLPPVFAMKKNDDPSADESRKLSHNFNKAKGCAVKKKDGKKSSPKRLSPAAQWVIDGLKGRHSTSVHRKKRSHTRKTYRLQKPTEEQDEGYIFVLPPGYKYDPKLNLWYKQRPPVRQSNVTYSKDPGIIPLQEAGGDSKLEKMIQYKGKRHKDHR